jgi:hypothetical protein
MTLWRRFKIHKAPFRHDRRGGWPDVVPHQLGNGCGAADLVAGLMVEEMRLHRLAWA